MNELQALTAYYETHDEDGRLLSRHGSVEFLTTVRYAEAYLRPGMRLIEIGAGTGRYSHYFARKGYAVDAIELIEQNLERLRAATLPGEDIRAMQGNATDLSAIPSQAYDAALLLGPMYHLFTDGDRRQALAEALRVLKPGGLLFAAYCMNEATIIQFCFQRGGLRLQPYRDLVDPITFKAASTPREVFALYRKEEIDALMTALPARRLHFIGTDMYTNYYREMIDAMDEDLFERYLSYHFVICERADMVGMSHHTLDISSKA